MPETTYRTPNLGAMRPKPADLGFYADIQFDASDAAPIYIGMNLLKGASNNATDWKIYKMTYSGADVTRIQLAYGAWTLRATYF